MNQKVSEREPRGSRPLDRRGWLHTDTLRYLYAASPLQRLLQFYSEHHHRVSSPLLAAGLCGVAPDEVRRIAARATPTSFTATVGFVAALHRLRRIRVVPRIVAVAQPHRTRRHGWFGLGGDHGGSENKGQEREFSTHGWEALPVKGTSDTASL